MIEFVDLAAQRRRIEPDLQARLARVFAHGRYIDGPEVGELELRLAIEAGGAHCIACGNGTDALTIALLALGVGPGREVVTPAFSYIAAAEAIALVGATPVFVDQAPTSSMSPRSSEPCRRAQPRSSRCRCSGNAPTMKRSMPSPPAEAWQ
jgi:UDP-2-acetamido-2-deoxy-ribo-hexuluronate aminotransferase